MQMNNKTTEFNWEKIRISLNEVASRIKSAEIQRDEELTGICRTLNIILDNLANFDIQIKIPGECSYISEITYDDEDGTLYAETENIKED